MPWVWRRNWPCTVQVACPWLLEMASDCLSWVLWIWPSRGFRLSELCLTLGPSFEGSLRFQNACHCLGHCWQLDRLTLSLLGRQVQL